MTFLQRITPAVSDIHAPAPLRDLPLWCVWAYEQHEGETKARKVPQYSMGGRRHGQQGSPSDRGKLTTFAVARDAAARRGLDGVGIALLPDAGIVALDFDNCVVDGRVDPEVMAAVRGTYAEYSPSGRGVRAIVRGDLGDRKSPTTATDFGTELFSTTGFCTITGNMLPHVDLCGWEDTIGEITPELEALCERRFGIVAPKAVDADDFMIGHAPKLGVSLVQMSELVNRLDPDVSREDWIRVGMALHHETDGSEDGFQLWNDWSANGYKYPSEEALRGQWDSFERRRGSVGKQVTMATVKWMVNEAAPVSVGDIIAQAEKLTADFEPTEEMRTPHGWKGKFSVVSAEQATQAEPVKWLIKGVIPAADIFSIYGASGAGKSFVALDLSAAIARGVSWRGRKTRKGRVIIVAAEGGGSYGNRLRALANKLCVDLADLDIGLIIAQPNILDQRDISELVASIKAVGDVDLVIIDTLAQVTPGANENTSEDMGRALANCRKLREATGATIGIVHHAGKDLSRGARGWSGLKGAMDAELEVNREGDGDYREIVVKKQKDGRDGERFAFRLETVVLGHDEDGDEITSCVVMESGPRVKKPSGTNQQIVYSLVNDAGSAGIEKEDLLDRACLRKKASSPQIPSDGKRDQTRQHFKRALDELLAKESLIVRGNRVFVPELLNENAAACRGASSFKALQFDV